MADELGFAVDEAGINTFMLGLAKLADSKKSVGQAMLAGSLVLERAAKEQLEELVYSKTETWYRRGKGSGLFGATQATNKLNASSTEITTGVESKKKYAVYVMLGTGIYAVGGDGRKTPWAFEDEQGELHWTVGQRPKPYLTLAAQKSKTDILKIIAKSLGGNK